MSYRDLDASFDREFRNALNANFDDVDTDIKAEATRATSREDEIDGRVSNIVAQAGDSNTEIADARLDDEGETHATLKERLDTQHQKVTTDMAQIEAEKASKEELNALGQLKLSGEYDTLSDLESAHPTGAEGVFLVIADGYTYRWNGSAWVQGAQWQQAGIANNSVDNYKLTKDVQKLINTINYEYEGVPSASLIESGSTIGSGSYTWLKNLGFKLIQSDTLFNIVELNVSDSNIKSGYAVCIVRGYDLSVKEIKTQPFKPDVQQYIFTLDDSYNLNDGIIIQQTITDLNFKSVSSGANNLTSYANGVVSPSTSGIYHSNNTSPTENLSLVADTTYKGIFYKLKYSSDVSVKHKPDDINFPYNLKQAFITHEDAIDVDFSNNLIKIAGTGIECNGSTYFPSQVNLDIASYGSNLFYLVYDKGDNAFKTRNAGQLTDDEFLVLIIYDGRISGLNYFKTKNYTNSVMPNTATVDHSFIMPTNIYLPQGTDLWCWFENIVKNSLLLNGTQELTGWGTNSDYTRRQGNLLILESNSVDYTYNLLLRDYSKPANGNNYTDTFTKSINVNYKTRVTGTTINTLVIADSFFNYNYGAGIMQYMEDMAIADGNTLNFKGTRTTQSGHLSEAYGGWNANDFLTHYVPISEQDPSASSESKKVPSPFVFSDDDTVENAYFDFGKYLTDNSITNVDNILIFLGMNGGDGTDLNTMITKIKEASPTVNIFVSLVPTAPANNNAGIINRELQNISYVSKFDSRELENIILMPTHTNVHRLDGIQYEVVNKYQFPELDNKTIKDNNGIHPTALGAKSIAYVSYNNLLWQNS